MSRTIQYVVRLNSDVSGARDVTSALDSLAMRGGAVQQVFFGLEQAARGNLTSLFGVARALKVLFNVLTTGTLYVRALVLVMAAALVAFRIFSAWQDRQAKSAGELQKATDRLAAAQQRLNELRSAAKAPSYEPKIKALRDLPDDTILDRLLALNLARAGYGASNRPE